MTPNERRAWRVSMILSLRGSKSTLTQSMVEALLLEYEGYEWTEPLNDVKAIRTKMRR